MSNNIFRLGSKTLLARGLGAVLLFLLNIVFGRVLGAEQYGTYNFVLAAATILAAVAAIGVPTAMLRFIPQYTKLELRSKVKGLLLVAPVIPVVLGLVVAAVILVFLHYRNAPDTFESNFLWIAIITPIYVLERLRRNIYTAYRQPIGSIVPDELLRPAILIVLVYAGSITDVQIALGYYAGVTCFLAVVFIAEIYRREFAYLRDVSPELELGTWVRAALPMALGAISLILMNRTDVTMLGLLSDMDTVGKYSAANRIASLNQFALGSMGAVVSPMLASAWHSGETRDFWTVMNRSRLWIIGITAPLCAVMWIFGAQLLALFGEEFVSGKGILDILVFGQFINAAAGVVGTALLMAGRERDVAFGMLMIATLNIALNAYAIPRWSGEGAAYVTAFCLCAFNAWMLCRLRIMFRNAEKSK